MKSDIEQLLDQAEAIAREQADGHLSVLRFTSGWKAFLGSPPLYWTMKDIERAFALPTHPDIESALRAFVESPAAFL